MEEKLDLMIVVGGWDSSNTHHLAEISVNKGINTYWVNKVSRGKVFGACWGVVLCCGAHGNAGLHVRSGLGGMIGTSRI